VTVEVSELRNAQAEAFNALTQIMSQDRDLMKVAGDLLFKAADFPWLRTWPNVCTARFRLRSSAKARARKEQDMQQKMTQMGQMIEHLSQMLQDAREGKGPAGSEYQGVRR
jgi:hypothetical protein